MDQFEDLKQKYQGALATIKREGVKLAHLNMQDNKLFTLTCPDFLYQPKFGKARF